MLRKHLSDETLIEHLDGELSFASVPWVGRHLKACWQCRARLAELEEQVLAVAQAVSSQSFPGPRRIDAARRRFFALYERRASKPPNLAILENTRQPVVWAGAAAAAAAVLMVLCVASGPDPSRQSPLDPHEVLAAVRGFETGLHQDSAAIHQSFQIEASRVEPAGPAPLGRLEIWAEPQGGRFACRWTDANGALQYAAWRPAKGRELVYDPGLSAAVVPRTGRANPEVSLAGLTGYAKESETLEEAFLNWLRSREWQPVSFTDDLYAFADEDGMVLEISRGRSRDGRPALRVSAGYGAGDQGMALILEVDAESYRPRLQAVRFGAVEWRLVLEDLQSVPKDRLRPAVFRPGISWPSPGIPATRTAPAPMRVPTAALPTSAELDTAEIEALYVLHRTRACLGEPLQVLREPAGHIRVHGLADTEERRLELQAALSEVRAVAFVSVHIDTIAEAAMNQEGPPAGEGSVELDFRRIVAEQPPVHRLIERYFRLHPEAASEQAPAPGMAERIAAFSTRAVSSSRQMRSESWAIRRLAERFGSRDFERLRPQSRWLVEVMLRDHLTALESQAASLRSLLEPVLSQVDGYPGGFAESGADHADGTGWAEICMDIFNIVERADSQVAGLFAGGGALDAETVDSLLPAFPRLGRQVNALQGQVSRDFSGYSNQASSWQEPR